MTTRREEAVVVSNVMGRGTAVVAHVVGSVTVIDHVEDDNTRGETGEVTGGGTDAVTTVVQRETPGTRRREAATTVSREGDVAEMTGKDVSNRDRPEGGVAVKVTSSVPSGHS